MNGNNKFGYTNQQINECVNLINNANQQISQAFTQIIQKEFVDELSNLWVCQEAVDFFKDKAKIDFDKLSEMVNSNFKEVSEAVNRAGSFWARSVGAVFRRTNFVPKKVFLDVASFKENIDDFRGVVDINKVKKLLDKLQLFKNRIEEILESTTKQAITRGFDGAEQQIHLLVTLKNNRGIIIEYINGLENALINHIYGTLEKYERAAKNVADSLIS